MSNLNLSTASSIPDEEKWMLFDPSFEPLSRTPNRTDLSVVIQRDCQKLAIDNPWTPQASSTLVPCSYDAQYVPVSVGLSAAPSGSTYSASSFCDFYQNAMITLISATPKHKSPAVPKAADDMVTAFGRLNAVAVSLFQDARSLTPKEQKYFARYYKRANKPR